MPVFKTQFKKSSAVRNEIKGNDAKLGPLKNDISIMDVKELEAPKGTKSERSAIIFEYKNTTLYTLEEPKNKNLGEIEIVGEIVFIEEDKVIKEILKKWKKDKKIDEKLLEFILNVAFEEAQIEALEQAKKVMLPPPIPLPRLRAQAPSAPAK